MWNIIVCDDELHARQKLLEYLDRFTSESGEAFRSLECSSAEQLLCQLRPDTDLIFLDIRMEKMNGMEAAHMIRRTNNDVCLIFLTSMVQYAVEGYRVHAYGFLQKPLTYAQFRLQMSDVLTHLKNSRTENLPLRIGSELHNVALSQILYAEVRNHNVDIRLKDRTLTYYGTITEIEQQLETKGFFRCHKSYLINMRYIKQIEQNDVKIENGDILPLSKRRRKEFLDRFTEYLGSLMP